MQLRGRVHPVLSRAHRQGPRGGRLPPAGAQGDAQPFAPDFFDGDENACVDFRYSQDPRLTWWFDHHASAFQLPGDEDHFRADATGRKFYDPKAKSCTKFLADTVAAEVRLRRGAARRADPLGRDHRRRAVPRRQDGRRAEGAGAAPDDLHREQPRPGAGGEVHRRSGQPAAGRDRRRSLRDRSRWSRCSSSTSATSRPSATAAKLEGSVVFFDLADRETRPVQQVHLVLPLPGGALLGRRDAARRARRSRSGRTPGRRCRARTRSTRSASATAAAATRSSAPSRSRAPSSPRAREIARDIVAELQTLGASTVSGVVASVRRGRLTPDGASRAAAGDRAGALGLGRRRARRRAAAPEPRVSRRSRRSRSLAVSPRRRSTSSWRLAGLLGGAGAGLEIADGLVHAPPGPAVELAAPARDGRDARRPDRAGRAPRPPRERPRKSPWRGRGSAASRAARPRSGRRGRAREARRRLGRGPGSRDRARRASIELARRAGDAGAARELGQRRDDRPPADPRHAGPPGVARIRERALVAGSAEPLDGAAAR